MAGIAQKRTKLSGRWYERGEVVPTELVRRRLVDLRILAVVPDAAVAGVMAGERPTVEAYDPIDHTVEDVLRFVDEYPGELDRVRAAEARGHARKTLLPALDERIADREAAEATASATG